MMMHGGCHTRVLESTGRTHQSPPPHAAPSSRLIERMLGCAAADPKPTIILPSHTPPPHAPLSSSPIAPKARSLRHFSHRRPQQHHHRPHHTRPSRLARCAAFQRIRRAAHRPAAAAAQAALPWVGTWGADGSGLRGAEGAALLRGGGLWGGTQGDCGAA